MIPASRNQIGLTEYEVRYCVQLWDILCGNQKRELVTAEASRHSSRTRLNETDGKVYLGADVKPGKGLEANARLSESACLAHELSHAERFEMGFERPLEFPNKLVDEAETSLHASFMAVLSWRDVEDLVEDAMDRLNQWLVETRERRRL